MSEMSREDVRERLSNIDQIRDIIFGIQLREYDNRFGKLESDISLLQQEMRSHVEQLKANLTAELKVDKNSNYTPVPLLETKKMSGMFAHSNGSAEVQS